MKYISETFRWAAVLLSPNKFVQGRNHLCSSRCYERHLSGTRESHRRTTTQVISWVTSAIGTSPCRVGTSLLWWQMLSLNGQPFLERVQRYHNLQSSPTKVTIPSASLVLLPKQHYLIIPCSLPPALTIPKTDAPLNSLWEQQSRPCLYWWWCKARRGASLQQTPAKAHSAWIALTVLAVPTTSLQRWITIGQEVNGCLCQD